VGDHAASAAGSCDWRHGCQGSDRQIATTAELRTVLAGEIHAVLKHGCIQCSRWGSKEDKRAGCREAFK
jgi:hypothetical protein